MSAAKKKAPEVFPEIEPLADQDPHYAESETPVGFDVGVLLAKDRAGPIREKHPQSEGAANFSSMKQRAEEAVAAANASAEE